MLRHRSLRRPALLAAAVVVTSAFGLATPLRAQTAEATIDRAVAAYAKVRTARASFEQTLTNPLTGNTSMARGDYQQQVPGKLAVTFTAPRGDRIVADGKAVWVYLPSSAPGQVIKLAPAAGAAAGVDLAALFLSSPRTKYTMSTAGTALIGGRKTRAVLLTPKEPMQFSKATVWVDDLDATLRQFEVVDGMGLVRKVRITKLQMNVPVDRSAFTFTPPAGVKVYDQAALMGGR